MIRLFATAFGLGLLRPAPGTWGSLGAVLLGWAIDRYAGFPGLLMATMVAIWAGFAVCARLLADRPGDDPSEVVIDEVAGQWIALLLPSLAFWTRGWEGWLPWPAPLAAFLFFRLFDIWKPWLVGRADARGDAAGVMLDDLWAGLFAGIATVAAGVLWHAPLFWS
ncbi:phosphatidylglycerophosphatase A [Frigidibacter sp. RF13]|uniref:phosphatidylglycerophosphatase A family protein n=1 Tax=Frigidibacter sp. RF13 TaxID=2997340 RepID=UPI00226E0590|nr:phosphatidylglycerophosphatase A [Frigidibacter sp. RF13]MCY1125345.1 phosphatidylglycerophosphatase A [Frigidibacter sp. RF13]